MKKLEKKIIKGMMRGAKPRKMLTINDFLDKYVGYTIHQDTSTAWMGKPHIATDTGAHQEIQVAYSMDGAPVLLPGRTIVTGTSEFTGVYATEGHGPEVYGTPVDVAYGKPISSKAFNATTQKKLIEKAYSAFAGRHNESKTRTDSWNDADTEGSD